MGGAEGVLFALAKELACAGDEVHIVSDAAKEVAAQYPNIRFHYVGIPSWVSKASTRAGFLAWLIHHLVGNLAAFIAALRVLRKEKHPFDVVHCHGNLSALLLTTVTRIPIVYTEHDSTPWSAPHGGLLERMIRRLAYRLLDVTVARKASRLVSLYEAQRREFIERWSIPGERIKLIPNGVRLLTSCGEPSHESRVRAFVSQFGNYCLFVGRLEPRKGVDILIEALRDETIPAWIIGDGPWCGSIAARVAALGMSERVRLGGFVEPASLAAYYESARLFVLPSRSESFPLSVLEAMSMGIPVVVSRVGAMEELVEENRCGLVVNPSDPKDLKEKILLLMGDPKLAQELGANGREAVLSKYAWNAIAQSHRSLYRTLSGSNK